MSNVHDYAVYAEYSPESKPVEAGWNPRVFTKIEAQVGSRIGLDTYSGVITLAPGTYHISGFSVVTYATLAEPPEMVTTRCPAAGGYCRLRYAHQDQDLSRDESNEQAICIGSSATANAVPSLFETYVTTKVVTRILLEHQSGDNPDGIFLRVYTEESIWHVFARISIRRLAETEPEV